MHKIRDNYHDLSGGSTLIGVIAICISFALVRYIIYTLIYHLYISPLSKYLTVERDYILPTSLLRKIRTEYVSEMIIGLNEPDHLSRTDTQKVSSLAMLSSHIKAIPNGKEQGIYYALDWGGSNYRVSRIQFFGKNTLTPTVSEYKERIAIKYKKCDKRLLFDHLSLKLKQELIKNGDYHHNNQIGFTFSFPIHQTSSTVGILKEWRKGFDIPGVIGQNVVSLMHQAFIRNNINANIHCIIHDAVGTLLSAAYCNDNVRIGLIVGTGTNAAYIEPNRSIPHKIINIEWGSFISRSLTQYLTCIDTAMDKDLSKRRGMAKYATNQFVTKLISGNFLGELVRKLIVDIWRNNPRWNEESVLNEAWSLQTEVLSDILLCFYDEEFSKILDMLYATFKLTKLNENDAVIIAKICRLIVNRSADLSATMLLGTLEKTGLYVCDGDDGFILSDEYKDNDKYIGVGIDGSVYRCIPRYKQRMIDSMISIVGYEIANKIQIVNAKDGSGTGAALAVATNDVAFS